jgi:hypothetical protein
MIDGAGWVAGRGGSRAGARSGEQAEPKHDTSLPPPEGEKFWTFTPYCPLLEAGREATTTLTTTITNPPPEGENFWTFALADRQWVPVVFSVVGLLSVSVVGLLGAAAAGCWVLLLLLLGAAAGCCCCWVLLLLGAIRSFWW